MPFILLLFRGIKLHPKSASGPSRLYLLMVICADGRDLVGRPERSRRTATFPLAYLMDVGAVLPRWAASGCCTSSTQLKQRPIFLATGPGVSCLPEGHHHGH